MAWKRISREAYVDLMGSSVPLRKVSNISGIRYYKDVSHNLKTTEDNNDTVS